MENELNCPACEKQYTQSNPPRLLAACGHSFCEKCLKQKIQEKDEKFIIVCPQDSQQITLKENNVCTLPKNRALMKFIQNKKNNSSFKDPELEMSKITKTEEVHNEDEQARQIVQAMALSNSVGQISQEKPSSQKQEQTKIETQNDQEQKQQPKQEPKQEPKQQPVVQKIVVKKPQICKAHQKPLEVVCIIDMKRICVNCAIFGEHKGHQFKSLEQIENERAAYYSSILEIMEKKNTITDRLSNQQTCSSIMDVLGNKKLKMKSTISQKFKKLTQAIQSKQKQSLKNLDSLIQKTEAKLKNLMKVDSQIAQKYDLWEQKSFQQIKILEGDNFQAKLHLIFSENGEEADVVDEGDQIIIQMAKQEENLINEVEVALQNIGVDFNLQIFNYIEGFIEIFDEIKKKKPKSRVTKLENQQNVFSNQITAPKNSISTKKQQSPPQLKQQVKVDDKIIHEQLPKIEIIPVKNPSLKDLHHQQSLLELQQQFFQKRRPEFVKTEQIHIMPEPEIVLPSPARRDKNIVSPSSKLTIKNNSGVGISEPMSPKASKLSKKDDSFTQQKQQKAERPNKKRLSRLKLPQKYDKIVDNLVNDQTEIVDLTNAELGDATITLISQFLTGSKVKTVKFIRNKLTDDAVLKIMPYLRGVITLNLSQNSLTQRVLDILIDNRDCLQSIKSVILSQNKIAERKAKTKIDKLKSLDIIVSI